VRGSAFGQIIASGLCGREKKQEGRAENWATRKNLGLLSLGGKKRGKIENRKRNREKRDGKGGIERAERCQCIRESQTPGSPRKKGGEGVARNNMLCELDGGQD